MMKRYKLAGDCGYIDLNLTTIAAVERSDSGSRITLTPIGIVHVTAPYGAVLADVAGALSDLS